MLKLFIEQWNTDISFPDYGDYGCLVDQVKREGDQLVMSADVADIVLKAPIYWPNAIMEGSGREHFWLTRWWTGKEFKSWQMVGIPIRGLMGDENGGDVVVGSAIRYIPTEIKEEVFKKYSQFLDESNTGPITIGFTLGGKPIVLSSGFPHWSIYPWLETRNRTRIVEAIQDGEVFAKWAVGLLATRAPWPYAETQELFQIEGMTEGVRRHFWFNHNGLVELGRSVVTCQSNLVGVSTGWSTDSLRQAFTFAHEGLAKLQYRERQIRPGMLDTIKYTWAEIKVILGMI